MVAVSVFFFFSSRRRHTRWPRDWSSDVCSSDLCFAEVHLGVCRSAPFECVPAGQVQVPGGVRHGLRVVGEPKIGRAACRERAEDWMEEVMTKRDKERDRMGKLRGSRSML